MKWTDQQTAIFAWGLAGKGNLAVCARAGSSKTTSIIEVLRRLPWPQQALLAAFNKHSAEDLQLKLGAGSPHKAMTLHALGFQILREQFGPLKVNPRRAKGLVERVAGRGKLTWRLAKLATSIKDGAPWADTREDVIRAGLRLDSLLDEKDMPIDEQAEIVLKVMQASMKIEGEIDYSDMISVVYRGGWKPLNRYDLVAIDELQDCNPGQLELASRALNDRGRMMIVGDPFQCIPSGQRVLTPSGEVPIETIRQGDYVCSFKAGEITPRRILRVTRTVKSEAWKFTLENGGTFQATADHVVFGAIDDSRGAYLYMMYRRDLGFRIGVSQASGAKKGADYFVMRSQQESAERMWILDRYATFAEAAKQESYYSLRFRIPKEPFKARPGMWMTDLDVGPLFAEFGQNGAVLLKHLQLDFERPNYIAKSSGRKGAIAINILIATKDGHRLEVESSHISAAQAAKFQMTKTTEGWRTRRCFRSLQEISAVAANMAVELNGYVVEHLSGTGSRRRMMAIPASSLNVGSLVPAAVAGNVIPLRIVAREKVIVNDCYDLEVEELGTFFVNGVIVHNSLYAFRGAAEDGFDSMRHKLSASELPLTISFRCSKKVIAEAQKIVPDIQARPGAPDGNVDHISEDEMVEAVTDILSDSSNKLTMFCLSRFNAPLFPLALRFLKNRVPFKIQGNEYGEKITDLIEKLKPSSKKDLELKLKLWLQQRLRSIPRGDDPEDVQARADAHDIVDAIGILNEQVDVESLVFTVKRLFEADAQGGIILSTVHRAKGREADIVFILEQTLVTRNPRLQKIFGCPQVESNIEYVATTRAKLELWWIDTPFTLFDKSYDDEK